MNRLLPKKRSIKFKLPNRKILSGALILVLLLILVRPSFTSAAAAQQVYLRLDRLKASTATGGTVCMHTNAGDTGTEDGVRVDFPSDFTINETEANWSVTTTNLPGGATAWPSISAPTGSGNYQADNTSKYVWFVGGNLSANTLYCFNFSATNTLTNPSAGNSKTGSISAKAGASTTDTGNYAVSIISEDQITVTATVPAIFTLSLSGTSIAHGTLTAGTVDTGSVTATLGTNAATGWVAWVKANTEYLNSAASGGQIASVATENDDAPTALSGSTYGWALDVILTQDADGDGTISQDTSGYGDEYDGDGTSGCSGSTTGGYISDIFRVVANSNGTSDNEQIELCSLVRVTAYQEAATDYTATLTFTAAGRF